MKWMAWFLGAILAPLPVLGDQQALLTSDRETVVVALDTTQMTVFFGTRQDLLDVTLLFQDEGGPVMRTRVSLEDGQSHTLTFPEDDWQPVARFKVRRTGRAIEATATALAETELAISN